jgi:hypothetical protein
MASEDNASTTKNHSRQAETGSHADPMLTGDGGFAKWPAYGVYGT